MNVHAAALAEAHRFDDAEHSAFADRRARRDLTQHPKRLSPKYFYDAARLGAVRADHAAAGILSDPHRARHPARPRPRDIAAHRPDGAALVEFGAGATTKVRLLLERLRRVRRLRAGRYFRRFPEAQAGALRQDFPNLTCYPVEADFTAPFALPAAVGTMPTRRLLSGLDDRQFRAARGLRLLRSARESWDRAR